MHALADINTCTRLMHVIKFNLFYNRFTLKYQINASRQLYLELLKCLVSRVMDLKAKEVH